MHGKAVKQDESKSHVWSFKTSSHEHSLEVDVCFSFMRSWRYSLFVLAVFV